jgi:Gluconate 2-dehydrogenase subunit 3
LVQTVLAPVRQTFRAIATTVVPEAASMDDASWADLERIVEEALATRPARMRRQLRLLIRAIQLMPIARYGRPFTALDGARRSRLLRALESSPILVLRRGFWGLRTLVFMGYYARPAAAAEIGYGAHVRGWAARESR